MGSRMFTTADVAEMFAVSPACVRKWFANGQITGMAVGDKGKLRFEQADIDAFKARARGGKS